MVAPVNTRSLFRAVSLSLLAALALCAPAQAERLKDLTTLAGVRSNHLIGYGLVVGLDGTGDQTTQAPFTSQSFLSMLRQFGIALPEGVRLQLKNVAAVSVHGSLPPFSKPGRPNKKGKPENFQ